ncbi:MAG: TetR/AcrR family transcriptional regulator [Candidatus Binatus sp.]|uniref:TetR/AcrR family transcriptional regulator n=1 Tax=Candidatus Binatus sp. TaxID=2811406 RepID=UPI003BAE5302
MAGTHTIVRNLNRTREKILVAALAEFSARGFAGARVDVIARRARVNKRMLYYCFGTKQELYREILRRKIDERAEWLESTPDDFAGVLAHIYLSGGTDIDFVRLMEWEAIDSGGRKCVVEAERRALFEKAVARLRVLQRRGSIPRGADLTQLFISMLSLALFPLVMPQIIRLIHGMEPTDPRFVRQRANFLRWLGDRLAKPARTSRAQPRRGRVAMKPLQTVRRTQSSERPGQLA